MTQRVFLVHGRAWDPLAQLFKLRVTVAFVCARACMHEIAVLATARRLRAVDRLIGHIWVLERSGMRDWVILVHVVQWTF